VTWVLVDVCGDVFGSKTGRELSLRSQVKSDGKGLTMKKFVAAALAAIALSTAPAFAADLPMKAKPAAAPESPWDIAFGAAIASDYVWRGITQSNHQPSVASYFEPRYNINKDLQLYAGVGGASIEFPNRAAAEIDIYGGIRPTFGKLALDFGVWYYWYPKGQTFAGLNAPGDCTNGADLNFVACNTAKGDASFVEFFAKAGYAVTDEFSVGVALYYSPNVLNTGADGFFYTGLAKYAFPALSNGVQFYVSGDVGYWDLGTSDAFYGNVKYKSYWTWDVGGGFTWKVFTVDVRYIDTDLNKADCNAFTGDHTATYSSSGVTAINNGNLSNWCGSTVVGRISADLTVKQLK
jgi:hypothetical protein